MNWLTLMFWFCPLLFIYFNQQLFLHVNLFMFHAYGALEQGTSSQQSNGLKWRNLSHRKSHKLYNGASSGNPDYGRMSIEDLAAIRIQTAFRGFRVYMNTFYPICSSIACLINIHL